jgi:hypothetical protein
MSTCQALYNTPRRVKPASILTVGELITILQNVPEDTKIAQDNNPDMCGHYYVTDITLSNGRVCFNHYDSCDAADVEEMNVTGKWKHQKKKTSDSDSDSDSDDDENEKMESLVFNDSTNPAVILTVKSFLEILSTVPATAKVALWNEPHIYNTCYTSSMCIYTKKNLLVLCTIADGDAADVDETDRTGRWVEEGGKSDDDDDD